MATTTKPEIGSTYRTGDLSPVRGEFSCVKCEQAGGRNVITVSQGEKVPECNQCHAAVTWRLDRYV
jgi:NAD-dependent SIR2 family protein deacetylase